MTFLTEQDLFQRITPVTIPTAAADVQQWLHELSDEHRQAGQLTWLLAHTYFGVVWGKVTANGRWLLSSDLGEEFPALEPDNIMELRLFGRQGELYLWRTANELQGRVLIDPLAEESADYYEPEVQILWGTAGEAMPNEFTRMTDGEQRLMHAVPLKVAPAHYGPFHRPLRLHLRHYVTQHEETGLAQMTLSRLLHLESVSPTQEETTDGAQA